MMLRQELENYLAELLAVDRFSDYCPNGLQIEGREQVGKIVTGVTASQALIDQAIAMQADAILVHHGYFWKNEAAPITHIKKKRIQALMLHDISLFAYHLPLDVHPVFGNNVQLAKVLGLRNNNSDTPGEPASLLWVGETQQSLSLAEFAHSVEKRLQAPVTFLGPADRQIRKLALCTGAAQSMFEEAIINHAVDAFLTGEVSEPSFHIANEYQVGFLAAGHHATERFGIRALGEHLSQRFQLEHHFLDIPNPV